ncbi:Crp/Fnr family transcriptional regulator [Rhodococcus gannanensis]|uniref:Crp/Fnr family transcriptional regulator n=1 Tax=Rhodococcus gannanensis TaxID=1960308 RepID=A0ABW4P2M6_9NOCA
MTARSDSATARDHRFRCVDTVPLFASLPVGDRQRIAAIAATRRHRSGERLYRPGDEAGLYIVHFGRVRVYRQSASGAEQLIRILVPGEFLGETAVLADAPVDHCADALDDSEVCSIARRDVLALLHDRPTVAIRMLQELSERLSDVERRVAAHSAASVERRLADQLLQLAADAGSSRFLLPTTKKDLASYLGTTPETLSRRLSALQSDGAIRLGPGRAVEIVDARALGPHPGW